MDATLALLKLRPGAQWSIPAGSTNAEEIIWHDDTTPVTQEELDAAMALPAPEPTRAEQRIKRLAGFRDEADPLLFKAQRGEATMEEWQAKVEEIRARYPYPVS